MEIHFYHSKVPPKNLMFPVHLRLFTYTQNDILKKFYLRVMR